MAISTGIDYNYALQKINEYERENNTGRKFVELWRNPQTWGVYVRTSDGQTYYASEGSCLGEWLRLETACTSCGRDHGATNIDKYGRCEITAKKHYHVLHNLYFSRQPHN